MAISDTLCQPFRVISIDETRADQIPGTTFVDFGGRHDQSLTFDRRLRLELRPLKSRKVLRETFASQIHILSLFLSRMSDRSQDDLEDKKEGVAVEATDIDQLQVDAQVERSVSSLRDILSTTRDFSTTGD